MEVPVYKVNVDTSELEKAIILSNQLVEKIEAAKSLSIELSGIIEKIDVFSNVSQEEI